jgi:K+-sensing histidine kinase KdpD
VGGFAAGVATGLLVGVIGTFLLLLVVGVLTSERTEKRSELSVLKLGYVSAVVLAVFVVCHLYRIPDNALMLLLLLTVVAISRLGGVAYGFTASSLAATMLVWTLPPEGTLRVSSPEDRLAVALFIIVSIFTSRVIGRRKTPLDRASSSES